MGGIGWLIIIVASICILSAIYYFNRKCKKLGSVKPDLLHEDKRSDTQPTKDKCVKPPTIEYQGEEEADARQSPKGRNSPGKVTSRYYYAEERTKLPVKHDYMKLLEDSIVTPFPEESSPAMDYLREAYRLEKEGADQSKIDQLLHKAREADLQATDQYIIRLSFIKQRESRKTRYGA
jgi:hypothetical protein